MSILNQTLCASGEGNTGIGDCFYTPGIVRGGFLVPNSFELTEADLATEQTLYDALLAATLLPVGQRIYPLPPFVAITDNSGDPVTATLGYGGIVIIDDANNNWTFQYTRGGVCVNNQLRKFKGGYAVMFVDDEGLIATKNALGTGAKGIPLESFYAYPWKVNDRTNPASFRLQFQFLPKYVNERIAFAATENVVLTDVSGVQNVALKVVGRVANVVTATANLSCGGKNLVETYGSEFADPANIDELFKVINTSTGAPVTITSVAVNGLNQLAITLTATGAYNTTTGGMTLKFAPVADVEPVIGAYESNSVLIPAPTA